MKVRLIVNHSMPNSNLLSEYYKNLFIIFPFNMSKNQINEMFAFLSSEDQIPIAKVQEIYKNIFNEPATNNLQQKYLTKQKFQQIYNSNIKEKCSDEQLLNLFFHLDRDKKGYLTPQDIRAMFEIFGKNVQLNDIENSFKYAKVYKNKMSFDDFKEYFINF